jgi:hypothetical protein
MNTHIAIIRNQSSIGVYIDGKQHVNLVVNTDVGETEKLIRAIFPSAMITVHRAGKVRKLQEVPTIDRYWHNRC